VGLLGRPSGYSSLGSELLDELIPGLHLFTADRCFVTGMLELVLDRIDIQLLYRNRTASQDRYRVVSDLDKAAIQEVAVQLVPVAQA
jgi:hypothetical protein